MNAIGRRRGLAVLAVLLVLGAGCRDEGAYPDRPITLLCPWSAGGGTDRLSRQMAMMLEEELGAPVNVINATGGSGVTGHTRGARARPDGYTLTMTTVELNMLHWRGMTNITIRDYEPLLLLNKDDAALFVAGDAPWQTLDELRAAIAERPGTLKASGTAQGGIWHVSVATWLDACKLDPDDVIWISINGAGPSIQEMLSGGVDLICCSLPEASIPLEAGQLRCLGVMAAERIDAFPEVPTFIEQGYEVTSGGWRALAVPTGVPPERVARLREALETVVASDRYREFMDGNGFNRSSATPAEWLAEQEALDEQFGAILTSDAFSTLRRSRYGPMVFPAVLGVALAATLAGLLAGHARCRARGEHRPADAFRTPPVLLCLAALVAYAAALEPLGYVATSAVFLVGFMAALGARLVVAVPVTLVLVPLTYQIFAIVLRVPLPWGVLGW